MESTRRFPAELGDAFIRRLLILAHFALVRAGGPPADALDVAQVAWIEIYRRWEDGSLTTLDPTELLRGLARTIVERRAIDAARSRRPEPLPPELRARAASTSTRLRRLDSRERVREVLDFVAAIGQDGDHELFILRHVDELSFAEIALRRGGDESPEKLRARLRRLHDAIRARFPRFGRP